MKLHVTDLFLAWEEHSLPEQEIHRVNTHLASCQACRSYFSKMGSVLRDAQNVPRVVSVPDPFLPARIRAMNVQGHSHPNFSNMFAPVMRHSMVSFSLVVAVILGIVIGKGMVPVTQAAPGETVDIITAYYGALSGQDPMAMTSTNVTASAGKELKQ